MASPTFPSQVSLGTTTINSPGLPEIFLCVAESLQENKIKENKAIQMIERIGFIALSFGFLPFTTKTLPETT
jgi:hypothetical protein